MRRALAFLPLALLFIANVVPSKAQKTAPTGGDPTAEVVVIVSEGQPLELACALRVEQRAEWRREGGALPAELATAEETTAPGGLTARLRAPAARPHLAGVYSCARGPHAQRLRVVVQPRALAASAPTARAAPAPGDAATSTLSPVSTTKKPVPDRAPSVPGSDSEPGAIQYYDVVRNTSLSCALANPSKLPVVWEKNNTEIAQVPELKDRFKFDDGGARFIIQRTIEEDYGNYSCKIGDARLNWQLHARPYTKLPSTDTSVVEGQKLKLVCRLIGKPAVPVEWYYNKFHTSYDPEEKELGIKIPVEGDKRIVVSTSDAGIVNGELSIEAAVREDAGAYACAPLVPDDDARTAHDPARTVLRVKDMYAALWPFLGICAEVLVLCAIILVYEKRRTKPEMEDSDTDNHDQKKS